VGLDLIYRVTCCGEPIYVGVDEVLAQRIFDHLDKTAGHATKLERSELNWWKIDSSPTTEGAT
jgi:predicted GIY-YIG superfamily endonuclease